MSKTPNRQSPAPAQTPEFRDEIAWRARRIPLSYSRHFPGQMTLRMRACAIEFESKLEHDAIAFLADCRGFRFVASQPFTVHFIVDGKRRTYTPDLLVVFDPINSMLRRLGFAHWTVVEVKPADRYAAHADEIGARLAHVTRMTGLTAICLTEREIKRGGHPS